MFVLLILSVILSSAVAKGGIEDNNAGAEFSGLYKLVYLYPKVGKPVPNCMKVEFSQAQNLTEDPFTCDCGRKSPNLSFILQKARGFYTVVLADIVNDSEAASIALRDICHCQPLDKDRTIFMKVNNNYLLYLDGMKSYLFSKTKPIEAEVDDILENYTDLIRKGGMLACVA